MKKMLLLLLCTPLLAHNPKHITGTDSISKTIKAHKAQQLKSAKRPIKNILTKLEHAGAFMDPNDMSDLIWQLGERLTEDLTTLNNKKSMPTPSPSTDLQKIDFKRYSLSRKKQYSLHTIIDNELAKKRALINILEEFVALHSSKRPQLVKLDGFLVGHLRYTSSKQAKRELFELYSQLS